MADWLTDSFMTTTFVMISLGVAFALTRTVLIISGLLKGPILRNFERYGDDEYFFRVLPNFLGWSGLGILMTNYWTVRFWNLDYNFWTLGLLLIATAFLTHRYPRLTGQQHGLFLNYPRWLHELGERTSRAERRRIAYMWLHLPFRLRLIYNSNDQAFLEWADMIIISTLI